MFRVDFTTISIIYLPLGLLGLIANIACVVGRSWLQFTITISGISLTGYFDLFYKEIPSLSFRISSQVLPQVHIVEENLKAMGVMLIMSTIIIFIGFVSNIAAAAKKSVGTAGPMELLRIAQFTYTMSGVYLLPGFAFLTNILEDLKQFEGQLTFKMEHHTGFCYTLTWCIATLFFLFHALLSVLVNCFVTSPV